jgi:cell division protein FtsN
VDSTDVDENLPSNGKDALRRIQSRIPFDRQIKEQQTVEAPKTEENAPLVKEKIKAEYYSVQLGAFSSDENASKFAFSSPVRKLAMMPSVRLNPANGLFVVQYGRFKTRFEAERALKELKKKNFKDVFIVKTNE